MWHFILKEKKKRIETYTIYCLDGFLKCAIFLFKMLIIICSERRRNTGIIDIELYLCINPGQGCLLMSWYSYCLLQYCRVRKFSFLCSLMNIWNFPQAWFDQGWCFHLIKTMGKIGNYQYSSVSSMVLVTC